MLTGKTILLGVTGGIAVYKSADLVSRLRKENANVEVVMTEGAKEFITPLTFQTMSNNMVHHKMFNEITSYDVEHISLAKKADMIVIAPATANTIGKIANGIADNLLTTVVMASKAKVLIAPAMNTVMYDNYMTQENMKKLKGLGYEFINPGSGLLACGDIGRGKMAEPVDIVEYIKSSFVKKDLKGKNITITAGPTIESLDPVRYITNHSSGKTGYYLAKNAVDRGAQVNLISGPTNLTPPKGVNFVEVKTTQDMFDAVGDYFDKTDVLIKSAAPSDFRPEKSSELKIKKQKDIKKMTIDYVENPDIVAYYGSKKKNQIIVGFAAETNDLYENANKKIKSKNLDFIVANDITQEGAGFQVETNIITIIDSMGNKESYPKISKEEVAIEILNKVKNML